MIQYCSEDIRFTLPQKRLNNAWLKSVAAAENRILGDVSIVFCSDPYLLDINRRFSGDLFISIDTVRANALEYGATFENELSRVMVHGLLHLIGYDDHTSEDQVVMRQKEDTYLSLLTKMQ